ncbi:FAD-dependent oxidoreductase [Novosphingobium sp. 9U]|uniref:oxidoreductase n=1 Tax=Novosphingobium sp. 9U TaxID=2653158 RepID=UPI00135B1750|nr:FAD-dependent oxidoreductase [Novosphingobium sp. 9U]
MSVHPRYPTVFSPIRLGPVELPNRYYFSPHGLPLTVGPGPSNDMIAYCTERVRDGGCGLVILSCTVHDRGRHAQPCPYPLESVPAFRALADAVHAAGGKIFAQLWYNWNAAGHWQPFSPPAPILAPSSAQYAYGGMTSGTHAMTRREIALMDDAHRQAVSHLREAGFDGVEIHASHSGVLEQFLSPYFNRREDEYGGSLANRMRLLFETLRTTRAAAGSEMAVGMRFNCDELVEGGLTTDDTADILSRIAAQGLLDFVDLDIAMEPLQLQYGMPTVFVEEHVYKPYVEKVRGAAGSVPVLSVLGRVTRMADAEAALASGLCDMVGSTRELIAEPRFVRHAFDGNEALGRTCIACNWCLGGMADGAYGCAINPASYRERTWGVDTFAPAPQPSRVVVVGGGPAGLEAARVAALRGHRVTMFEARDVLGGALEVWARLPGREFYRHAPDWWERELTRLGVTMRKGEAASADLVLGLEPQAVVIATGAAFSREGRSGLVDRPIPGADRPSVHTPEDILDKGLRPTGRVVVLDGEGTHASAGVAELLARAGAEVTMIGSSFAPFSSRLVFAFESEFVAKRLAEAGVTFRGATWVRAIEERALTLFDVNSGRESVLDDIDAVVLATGRASIDGLARELEGRVPQLFTVGDALAVRPFATAAYEGHKFARLIGEPGAPCSIAEAYFAANDPAVYPAPAERVT